MRGLAAALDAGRVVPPFRPGQLARVPGALLEGVVAELEDLSRRGMAPGHIVHMLRLLAEEREAAQAIADRVELVWSGTEVLVGASRDTAVVVQELFREARQAMRSTAGSRPRPCSAPSPRGWTPSRSCGCGSSSMSTAGTGTKLMRKSA